MQLRRVPLAGMMAVALIAAGCSTNHSSGSTSTSTTTTSSSSAKQATTSTTSAPTTTSAQAGALDTDTCWDISSAKDDLMVADNSEKARAAADSLEKYSPPHLVRDAIEHYVTTLGAQADDPDNSALAYLLNDWVKQLCPNLK